MKTRKTVVSMLWSLNKFRMCVKREKIRTMEISPSNKAPLFEIVEKNPTTDVSDYVDYDFSESALYGTSEKQSPPGALLEVIQ